MKIKKKEKLKIELSVKEVLKLRRDFGKLSGVNDDMFIVEFMEKIDEIIW